MIVISKDMISLSWLIKITFTISLSNYLRLIALEHTFYDNVKFDQFKQFLKLSDLADNKTTNFNKNLRQAISRSSETVVQWRQIIEKLLETRCSDEKMTILLHYETTYSRLTHYIAQDLKKCRFKSNFTSSNETRFFGKVDDTFGFLNLTFAYSECSTCSTNNNGTLEFSNQIVIECDRNSSSRHLSNIRETFDVNCHKTDRLEQIYTSQALRLYENNEQLSNKLVASSPFTVTKGSSLYLQGFLNAKTDIILPVEVFPVNCWTEPVPETTQKIQNYFFQEGCPVNDNKGRGLSTLHHFRRNPTKVTFSLENSLILPKRQQMIRIFCQTIPCVKSFTIGVVGLQKCPIAHYCAGDPFVTHKLPDYLKNVPQYYTSTGILNVINSVVIKNKTKSPVLSVVNHRHAAVEQRINCVNMCSTKNMSTFLNNTNHQHVLQKQTVKVSTTVAISLLSFLLGFIIAGLVWTIQSFIQSKSSTLSLSVRFYTKADFIQIETER